MQALPRQTAAAVSQSQGMYKADSLDSQGDGKLGTVYSNQKTSFYSNMQQSRGPITPTEMFRSPE